MRRATEHVPAILDAPDKTARLTLLRGDGVSVVSQDGGELGAAQGVECPGGGLANPLWLPGYLFGDAGGEETPMPRAVQS
jgi:hypothetical protein